MVDGEEDGGLRDLQLLPCAHIGHGALEWVGARVLSCGIYRLVRVAGET